MHREEGWRWRCPFVLGDTSSGDRVNSSGNGSRQLQGLPAVSEVVMELETGDKSWGSRPQ